MNVPESPVVETGAAQILERAGAVGCVSLRRSAHVAVQYADLEARALGPMEVERQVLAHLPAPVAHAVDDRQALAVPFDHSSLDLSRREDDGALWPVIGDGRPARLQGVMVPVDDECPDSGLGQPGEPVPNPELGPQTPRRAVVQVSREYEEARAAL